MRGCFHHWCRGSGKSLLTKQLISHWNVNDWPVLFCKFDRQLDSLTILIQSFNVFFGNFTNQIDGVVTSQRNLSTQSTFDRISQTIISSTDDESFAHLCLLIPSFGQLMSAHYTHTQNTQVDNNYAHLDTQNEFTSSQDDLEPISIRRTIEASSAGSIGSGRNRVVNILHILFKAVCLGGQPTLVCE